MERFFIANENRENYKAKYNLLDYHINFVNTICKKFDLRGKRVLEIGGSNLPKEMLLNSIRVEKWVSVDTPWWSEKTMPEHFKSVPFVKFGENDLVDILQQHDYVIYKGYTDDITSDFYGQFDYVVSNCCFEHIQNFSYALEMIYECLKPGGELYTSFGPIWSSPRGHHMWIRELKLYFNDPQYIPPFAHLMLSRKQIYDILLQNTGSHKMSEKYSKEIKGVSHLNQYFYEDYMEFMKSSRFDKWKICPTWSIHVDPNTYVKLRTAYPNYTMFEADGIVLEAQK